MREHAWALEVVHKREGIGDTLELLLFPPRRDQPTAPYWRPTEDGSPLVVKVDREEFDATKIGDLVAFILQPISDEAT